MRILQALALIAVMGTTAFGAPGGVLANVTKIQVDPTVIERPGAVKDTWAASVVRYDLRAAVRDALLEEGESATHAHFVLDEFSADGGAKRLTNFGTGRSIRTVDGRLVIQDASGKALATVRIHLRGNIGLSPDAGNDTQGRQAASDFEQRLLEEIERLK